MAKKVAAKTDRPAKAKGSGQQKGRGFGGNKKQQQQRTKSKKSDTGTRKIPTIDAPALSSDDEVEDDDMEFVRENVQNLSFLKSMDPEKLSNITKEVKKKAYTNTQKQKGVRPAELTESEDEDDYGLVAEDSDSDLEVLSEDDGKLSDDEEDEDNDDLLEDLEMTGSEAEGSADEEDSVEDVESLSEDESASDNDDDDEQEDGDSGSDASDQMNYNMSTSKDRRMQKRKAMLEGSMGYEQQSRSFGHLEKKQKTSSKLPIKTADGRLVSVDDSEEEGVSSEDEAEDVDEESDQGSADSGSDADSDSGSESDSEDKPKGRKQGAAGGDGDVLDLSAAPDREQMTRKQYIVAQQIRLAGLADRVMQNPENGSKALRLLNEISEDKDPRVRQLGLLSQLAVYNDILPDYRIRELTEREKKAKVTKDVRQQRMQEESLIKNYSAYLKQLFTAVKKAIKIFKDPSADIATGVVAARALGELVNAHPHFNFRKDIMSALIDIYVQPSSRINFAAFTPMATTARLAILRLFRNDISGEYSQNAVILASKRIKRLSYRVDPSALRPWLHLRLREELRENPDDRKKKEEEQRRKEFLREKQKALKRNKGSAALKEAKRAMYESKKQVKARKVQQEVDKSLREAEAEVSREEREKWYGETLKQVFITYFRILKQKDNIGGLLPAVLEGLAKYAHLISVEFFVDLFHLLKKIMRGQHGVGIGAEDTTSTEAEADANDAVSSRVSLRTSLLCILTALHILCGQGEALNLDLKDFFYQLYALLPPLSTNAQIEATRMSALSDGTRYTVYLSPAEVAAANALRIGQERDAKEDGAKQEGDNQLNEAMWEETVRSEADLLFECLELMFLGRTKVSSLTRVSSFCKRLCEGALYWPPKTAVRAIEFVHRLVIKYPSIDRLFSSEEQAGSGLYMREMDDPDMCNPYATCLYELHWLQIHHNAAVQSAAVRLLEFAKAEEKKHKI
ncbi:hypothetical protein GGI07_005115 [Coemansia sp. Benny D115]|nr:hypothetical protein GGI07_005115 [Coemansia sp. Benny D115]